MRVLKEIFGTLGEILGFINKYFKAMIFLLLVYLIFFTGQSDEIEQANLALSQNRAFAVMDFINSWNKDDRLKKYIIASGKSFMSPVLRDGVEDKDASRRIEIKFTLSNKEAINEIQKFLEYDTNATKSE